MVNMKPRDETKPSRSDPISMRLSDKLKAELTEAAKAAGRTLNAEIRQRLEWSLKAGFEGLQAEALSARLTDADYMNIAERVAEILKDPDGI